MQRVLVILFGLVIFLLVRYWAYPEVYKYYYATFKAEEELLELPAYAEIKEYHPKEYQELVELTQEYIKTGDHDAILLAGQSKIEEVFGKDIIKAPPSAIAIYIDSVTQIVEIFSIRKPDCCTKLLNGDVSCFSYTLDQEEKENFLAIMGTVIRLANTNPSTTKINQKQAETDFDKIIEGSYEDDIDYDDDCEISQYLFNSISKLPPNRMANAFKYMITAVDYN